MEEKTGVKLILDFNACIDTSFGVIKYLKTSKKFDSSYFDENVMRRSDAYIKNRLIASNSINPLTIIFKEKYYNSIDDIWKELKETSYFYIIMNSIVTDIFRLSMTLIKAKEARIESAINCNNADEVECVSRIFKDYPILKQEYDMDKFDTLFCMEASDSYKYENLAKPKKALYLGNKATNFKDGKLAPDLVTAYFPCLINAADVYVGYTYMNREGMLK